MKTIPVSDLTYKHSVNKIMHPPQHIFDFYSEANNNKIGTLVCHKSVLPIRPNYNGSVLAIDYIQVADKNAGIGTKILNFAQEYSQQIGCKGFMTLKADTSYMPEKVPHIFYRKFGFSSFDKKTDKELDKFIRLRKFATRKDFPCLLMHYPPLPKKISKFNVLFKFLGKIF